jgi:hypothetical protein
VGKPTNSDIGVGGNGTIWMDQLGMPGGTLDKQDRSPPSTLTLGLSWVWKGQVMGSDQEESTLDAWGIGTGSMKVHLLGVHEWM